TSGERAAPQPTACANPIPPSRYATGGRSMVQNGERPIRKIGVLTSGGDCAGLNAVIRAVTDAATGRGWQVLGLRHGHLGLLQNPPDVVPLTAESVRRDLLRLGGTVLGTTT